MNKVKNMELDSVPITDDYDLIVICTNHKEYRDINFKILNISVIDCSNCIEEKPNIYYQA